jgi:hypothetical protein
MKQKTLVELAREVKKDKERTSPPSMDKQQMLELAIAYANKEITCTSAREAVKLSGGIYSHSGSIVTRLSSCFMTAIRQGRIKFTVVDK